MKKFKDFVNNRPKIHKHFIGKMVSHPEAISEGYFEKNLQRIHTKADKPVHPSEFSEMKRDHLKAESIRHLGTDLSSPHVKAINIHTSASGCHVNATLFYGIGFSNKKDLHEHHQTLSEAIQKVKSSRNFHVFSGMRSPENYESHNGLIHVHNPAYTSTSIRPIEAIGFTHTRTYNGYLTSHLYLHKGRDHKELKQYPDYMRYDPNNPKHKKLAGMINMGLSGEIHDDSAEFVRYSHMAKIHIPAGSHGVYVDHISQCPGEHEYLLHHGCKIAFKETPTLDHDKKLVVWHGKLTHDGVEPTRHGRALGIT